MNLLAHPLVRAIGRDPQLYKDADSFNPSRFLGDSSELDPRKLVFGFGRRICPGRSRLH